MKTTITLSLLVLTSLVVGQEGSIRYQKENASGEFTREILLPPLVNSLSGYDVLSGDLSYWAIDLMPGANSSSLVTSGGVHSAISDLPTISDVTTTTTSLWSSQQITDYVVGSGFDDSETNEIQSLLLSFSTNQVAYTLQDVNSNPHGAIGFSGVGGITVAYDIPNARINIDGSAVVGTPGADGVQAEVITQAAYDALGSGRPNKFYIIQD